MRQAAEWAVADGLLGLPEVDPYDVLAEKMANAVRSETRTDPLGRRYRVNHAVRVTKSGVQYTFWEQWDLRQSVTCINHTDKDGIR